MRAPVYAEHVGNVAGAPAERFAKQFTLIDVQLDPGGELLRDIPYRMPRSLMSSTAR